MNNISTNQSSVINTQWTGTEIPSFETANSPSWSWTYPIAVPYRSYLVNPSRIRRSKDLLMLRCLGWIYGVERINYSCEEELKYFERVVNKLLKRGILTEVLFSDGRVPMTPYTISASGVSLSESGVETLISSSASQRTV